MKLSYLLQTLGLVGCPLGAHLLWGAGAAVLVASLALVVLGVVLEREGS